MDSSAISLGNVRLLAHYESMIRLKMKRHNDIEMMLKSHFKVSSTWTWRWKLLNTAGEDSSFKIIKFLPFIRNVLMPSSATSSTKCYANSFGSALILEKKEDARDE